MQPIEALPLSENQLSQLSEMERANILFSIETKRKLKEALPTASDIPIIYIGSGGDAISALMVSGSKRVILVDQHPFLTSDGHKNELSQTYSTVEDMLDNVNPSNEWVGKLTPWEHVRPAVQMISHLEKIGISRNCIDIQPNGNDADIFLHLGDQVIEINFRSRRINSVPELKQLLDELSISGEYGLMAKGGAGKAVQTIIAQSENDSASNPEYFIVDDPRSMEFNTLTSEDEISLYPGYTLIENKSKENTGWGYSWGEEPNSEAILQEDEFDYRTRAVIGILK